MSEPFGFGTHQPGEPEPEWPDGDAVPMDVEDGDWAIWLPHQCDEWIIASDPDLEAFLECARRFRAELSSAIRSLEKAAGVRECGMKCGEWVRPVQPSDGVDGYEMVHLSGNPICPVTAEAC